jgi:HSP20 family protein
MKHDKKDREPASGSHESDTHFEVGRGAFQSVMLRRSTRKFSPPTDVIELPDRLVILVEIAGMLGDSFKITLHDRTLIISGIRERPPFEHPAYHQVEIGFGEFRVGIRLPWSVQADEVTATYDEGFLQVELPRRSQQIHIAGINTEEQE